MIASRCSNISNSSSSVQSKINCVFDISINSTNRSLKRSSQNYQVLATNNFSEEALSSDIKNASLSEKIDGTCCYMTSYKDKLCVWARFDRKLNKDASKRLREFNQQKSDCLKEKQQDSMSVFHFTFPDDLKVVPDAWIPANNVNRHPETDDILPDANGHVPGWLPISVDQKQYCWHHSATSEDFELILTLKEVGAEAESSKLCLSVEPMSNYSGKTLELIGTNVNANPYGLGNKVAPFHVYVPHGSIGITGFPVDLSFASIKSWFTNDDNRVEGIVWQCTNGKLFKLHRHHIGLPWPFRSKKREEVETEGVTCKPSLSARDVHVKSEMLQDIDDTKLSKLFVYIKKAHLKTFSSIVDMSLY